MEYEYDEFTSKKGTVIRLMDLEEYYKLLPNNEKSSTGSGELSCTCPYCMHKGYLRDPTYHNTPYVKHKLYIKSDFTTGFCHRCGSSYWNNSFNIHYELPSLVMEYGAPSLSDISFAITDKYYTLDLFNNLPRDLPEDMIDSLYNRNPYIMNYYEELNFRCLSPGRLAIPFYWKGELIYYQIWQKGCTPKYYMPATKNKPLYICGPIKNKAILVEGVFDAVAERILHPDHTPIAILGSSVTTAQDLMLRSLFFDSLIIRMDDSHKSYKVYNRIKRSLEFTDLEVLESDGTDSEEYLCYLAKWKKS